MPTKLAENIDVVFRCASADQQFEELEALRALRLAARESGVAPSATPGGGLGAFALEIALDLADEEEREQLRGLSAVIEVIYEERAAIAPGTAQSLTGEAEPTTRRIDSRQGRLPGLVSSKPATPQMQRIPMDLDDVSAPNATTLPSIPPYGPSTPEGRPTSKQFRYRPHPTGEGLARVFTCASADSLRVVEQGADEQQGADEPFFGLRILHDAVKAAKASNPHRLVKMPASRQWHANGQDADRLPHIPDGRPPIKASRGPQQQQPQHHVDAYGRPMEKGNVHAPQNSRSGHRLTTADRIARRFRDLQMDLDELQTLREMRTSHNQRLLNAAANKSGGSGGGAATSGYSTVSFDSNRSRSPNAAAGSGRTGTADASGHSTKLPPLSSTMGAGQGKAAARDARQAAASSSGSAMQGSRVRYAPPSAPSPTLNGTLTTRPATSLVDAVIESVKRQQAAPSAAALSSGAADASKSAADGGRGPVVPHRGVRASAASSLKSPVAKYSVSGVLL